MEPSIEKKDPPKRDDRQTKSRNKRMFGLLMGTLQQFKDDTKTQADKEKKRGEIEKKLEEKDAKEREEVASQKRELFQTRRQKQQELKRLELKMNVTELKTDIEAHYNQLENHIRLKSTPSIFYLPAVHTDATQKLLEESKTAVAKLLAKRFTEMDQSYEPTELRSVVKVTAANDTIDATVDERTVTVQEPERIIDVQEPNSDDGGGVKARLGSRLKGIADNYGNDDDDDQLDQPHDEADVAMLQSSGVTVNPTDDSDIIQEVSGTNHDDDPMSALVAAACLPDEAIPTNRRVIVTTDENGDQEEGEI